MCSMSEILGKSMLHWNRLEAYRPVFSVSGTKIKGPIVLISSKYIGARSFLMAHTKCCAHIPACGGEGEIGKPISLLVHTLHKKPHSTVSTNPSFDTFHNFDIWSSAAPYAPAGRPVRIEMKHVVIVRTHLYVGDQLNGFSGSSGPFQSTISISSAFGGVSWPFSE